MNIRLNKLRYFREEGTAPVESHALCQDAWHSRVEGKPLPQPKFIRCSWKGMADAQINKSN